jgi:hypothetical protein
MVPKGDRMDKKEWKWQEMQRVHHKWKELVSKQYKQGITGSERINDITRNTSTDTK